MYQWQLNFSSFLNKLLKLKILQILLLLWQMFCNFHISVFISILENFIFFRLSLVALGIVPSAPITTSNILKCLCTLFVNFLWVDHKLSLSLQFSLKCWYHQCSWIQSLGIFFHPNSKELSCAVFLFIQYFYFCFVMFIQMFHQYSRYLPYGCIQDFLNHIFGLMDLCYV